MMGKTTAWFVLLTLSGCSWVGSNDHNHDLAFQSLEFVGGTGTCNDGLSVVALVEGYDGTELTLEVTTEDGSSGLATGELAGGEIEWLFPDLVVSEGEALELAGTLSFGEPAKLNNNEPLIASFVGLELYVDADGDGFGAGELQSTTLCEPSAGWSSTAGDCDDASSAVNPGADELCSPLDENCDGSPTEGATDAPSWYPDLDGDDFGDEHSVPVSACEAPVGHVLDATDCDDSASGVNPEANERCSPGVDENCDGSTTDGAIDPSSWYPDADGDDYGDEHGTPVTACEPPTGHVLDATDCDDAASGVNPGEDELCTPNVDEDCDGSTTDDAADFLSWYPDMDFDGFGDGSASPEPACVMPGGANWVADGSDCADQNPHVNPGEDELCTPDIDENCDGSTTHSAVDGDLWYPDVDVDGFGDENASVSSCEPLPGHLSHGGDCDDSSHLIHPDADELCTPNVDENCDGSTTDDAVDPLSWYPDVDFDGFGDENASPVLACVNPGGLVEDATDCDDGDEFVSPNATEICNAGVDDDCDGRNESTDDDVMFPDFYIDEDFDGFGGDVFASGTSCVSGPGTGQVEVGGDCDDHDSTVHPSAHEVVGDAIDQDCDGLLTCFKDLDGDGFGTLTEAVTSVNVAGCAVPNQQVSAFSTDCDDADVAVNPNGTESPGNNVDENCDEQLQCYVDADQDGVGSTSVNTIAETVDGCMATGSSLVSDDCNDNSAHEFPGNPEVVGNGFDEDCDGELDCYVDSDLDAYGDGSRVVSRPAATDTCLATGFAEVAGDCDDDKDFVYPSAPELCDAVRNDCSATLNNEGVVTALSDGEGNVAHDLAGTTGFVQTFVCGEALSNDAMFLSDTVITGLTDDAAIAGTVEFIGAASVASLSSVELRPGANQRALWVHGTDLDDVALELVDVDIVCPTSGVSGSGGAVLVENGTLQWAGGGAEDCSASSRGGAVFFGEGACTSPDSCILEDLLFVGNHAAFGGAIAEQDLTRLDGAYLDVSDSAFSGNTSVGGGSTIRLERGHLQGTNTTVAAAGLPIFTVGADSSVDLLEWDSESSTDLHIAQAQSSNTFLRCEDCALSLFNDREHLRAGSLAVQVAGNPNETYSGTVECTNGSSCACGAITGPAPGCLLTPP